AQTVEYGKDVKLPTPAEKEGYTFKGWEGQTTGIKADGEVHAIYEKNPDTPGTETPGTVTPAPTADAAQTGSLAAMILMAFASLTAFFKRGKKSRR
ncbi:InlB B-repeat-containing protein, partial [Clostridium sp. HCP1S3_B4]|uniref:InlB B-repeat-containing protein n=1 Tax=unclassified Clostridium TaxID=2614128 RepID=UPI003F8B6310